MKEIVVYGRGGQGAVTAAQILAIAAFKDGKQSQAFPNFGVERRGAPVEAYARFSDQKINIRSQVYEPDYVIVLDASLVDALDVTKGLKKNGRIIINTQKSIKTKNYITHCFDATSVALEIFESNIVNTIMVAVFAKFTRELSKKAIIKAIDEVFSGEVAEKNKQAIAKILK